MESETVKDIKECLEVLNEYGETYITKDQTQRKFVNYADILSYINELESENKKLLESCKNCHYIKDLEIANGHAKELKDRIAELEKEIKGNVFYAKGYAEGIKNTYEVVMPNKLKQFAERLKSKDCSVPVYKGFILIEDHAIDETLKEFINTNKGEKL